MIMTTINKLKNELVDCETLLDQLNKLITRGDKYHLGDNIYCKRRMVENEIFLLKRQIVSIDNKALSI